MTLMLIRVMGGDWRAIYLDGEIHYQNHDIRDRVWLNLLIEGVRIDDVIKKDVKITEQGSGGYLPDTVKGIRESDDWKFV